jgi:type I restriction enzyme, S subunit
MFECVGNADWPISSVYDLATWRNGLAFKNIDFADVGRPVIKIAELKNGVTQQTARTAAQYDPSIFVGAGDMLFSWSGNPDTSIDVFRWHGEDGWLNQHIFKVKPRTGVSEDFLFFLLRWLRPRFAEIARNKQTHVTIQDLRRMMVGVPDVKEQSAITLTVGPLKEKIDLNRRMNETLEAMARAIFKDWFVDFGPTRAKMEGRASYIAPEVWALFPDRLDGKPAGWGEIKIENLLELAYGKSLPATGRRQGKFPVYGSGGLTGFHDEPLVEAPAIIVGRKGTVGSLYWEHRPCYPIDTVFYIRSQVPLTYCFHLLETLGMADMNTDAAVPGLNRSNVYRLLIPRAPEGLVGLFANQADTIRAKIVANLNENESLAAARDLLLPKLMSGEIRVKDAQKELERVA